MSPKVSINLCCYNSEKYLRETLDSIVSQTFKDWELVIVNDGSSDSTEQIIQEYIGRGYPIVYHSQTNAGLSYARNKALELSSGEFIAFIDHDDLWMSDKLQKQIPLFDDLQVGIVYSDVISFNKKGDSSRLYAHRPFYIGNCFSQQLVDYCMYMLTVIIRRKTLDDMKIWFDTHLSMGEDMDLFVRIAYNWKCSIVDEPLAKWRVHADSATWQRGQMFADEVDMMLRKYSDIIPDFDDKFACEISTLRRKFVINKAMCLWYRGENHNARRTLVPLLRSSVKAYILTIAMFFPETLLRPFLRPFRKTRAFPCG